MLNIDEMVREVEEMAFSEDIPYDEIKDFCKRNAITLVDYEDTLYDSGYDGFTHIISFVIKDEEGNIRCSLNNIDYLGFGRD